MLRGNYLVKMLVAFAFVAFAFMASTFYAQRRGREIDPQTDNLSGDELPSIERLVGVAAALRRLETACADLSDLGPARRKVHVRDIASARDAVDEGLERYLALPLSEAEYGPYKELAREIDGMHGSLDELIDTIQDGEGEDARATADEDLRPRIDRAIDLTRRMIEIDVREAHSESERIAILRHRSEQIAFGLDVACFALAAIAAAFAVRAILAHTKLMNAHRALVETRADELEAFANRVAHDLLNPLAGARLAIDAAAHANGSNAKAVVALDRGRRAIDRATRITQAIYRFARSGATPEPGAIADVHAVFDDVIDGIRASQPDSGGLAIVVEPYEHIAVQCAPGVLASIAENLLQNAVRYASAGDHARVIVRVSSRGGVVRTEIEDNGPGLPEASMQRVFEPYVRGGAARKEGLGLGLATVKRLCEGHGGAAGVRAAPGGGCVFWFELAAADAHPPPASGTSRMRDAG